MGQVSPAYLSARLLLLLRKDRYALRLSQSPERFAWSPGWGDVNGCTVGSTEGGEAPGGHFYNADFSSPWCFVSPGSRIMAPLLTPGADHVIIYHLLIEGRGFARLKEGNRVPLEAGDIVVFPHGDAHFVQNGSGARELDDREELKRVLSQGLKLVRLGATAFIG
jgi:Cupin